MRILAADDEPLMLDMLTDRIRQACPQGEVHAFSSARKLLEWVEENGGAFDAAFLDIEMPGMSGIALAQRLKELCPRGNLIFVTGYSQYMAEAFQLHASGYIMKPVTVRAVEEELRNLRYPPQQQEHPQPSAISRFFMPASLSTSAAAGPRNSLPTSSTAGGRGAPWGS